MASILGISGTPTRMGNIEKAMIRVMEASGKDFEMVRFSQLRLKPCIACLKCSDSNLCVQQDDMNQILSKIEESSAMVLGALPDLHVSERFDEDLYRENVPA